MFSNTSTGVRRAVLLLALMAAGGLIAACGSSSSSTTATQAAATGSPSSASGSSSARSARRAALVACLKQHGVTLPARPPEAGGGGGFFGGGGPPAGGASTNSGRGFFRNPKLQAALKACGANFGNFRGRRGLGRQRITSYVTCVRQHGYNMPNPNFSGNGPIFPPSIRSDPKFQAASRQCQNLLIRPGAGAGTATTGGSRA